jgi:RNA polymerase primary sigma factor
MTRPTRGSGEQADRALAAYFRRIGRIPVLSKGEELRLAREVQAGNEAAFRRLVEANLRFVVKVAMGYRGRGLPLQELIDEGNLGLVQAARRFSPDHEVRCITYAVWWIRPANVQALAAGRGAVRLPLRPPRGRSRPAAGNPPGAEWPEAEEADDLVVLSLGMSLGGGDGTDERMEQELQRQGGTPTADQELVGRAFRDEVARMLASLSSREREVIGLRFGLGPEAPQTLDAVGRRLRVSRERVRQIEERAKQKMVRVAKIRHLREFLQ